MYARIAEQIEHAIASGALPVGTKLPPQRNLAFDIGVTLGTIGRAYQIARERGLVSGEVGRGTYVLEHTESRPAEQADPLTSALAGTRPIKAPPGGPWFAARRSWYASLAISALLGRIAAALLPLPGHASPMFVLLVARKP